MPAARYEKVRHTMSEAGGGKTTRMSIPAWSAFCATCHQRYEIRCIMLFGFQSHKILRAFESQGCACISSCVRYAGYYCTRKPRSNFSLQQKLCWTVTNHVKLVKGSLGWVLALKLGGMRSQKRFCFLQSLFCFLQCLLNVLCVCASCA